jgi:hypothetical protein
MVKNVPNMIKLRFLCSSSHFPYYLIDLVTNTELSAITIVLHLGMHRTQTFWFEFDHFQSIDTRDTTRDIRNKLTLFGKYPNPTELKFGFGACLIIDCTS